MRYVTIIEVALKVPHHSRFTGMYNYYYPKPNQAFGDDNCFKNIKTEPIMLCGL